MKRLAPALIALLLLVAACGDDGPEADEALVNDLTNQILAGTDPAGDIPLTDEQAGCFAVGMIDGLGAERMVEALGMEFDVFMAQASNDDRLVVVDTMFDCVDFASLMQDQFGDAISDESGACLGNAFVGSDGFRNAMAASFGDSTLDPFDDAALLEEMLPAMLDCLSAEELLQLGDSDG